MARLAPFMLKGSTTQLWRAVSGGCSALIATLVRLGWGTMAPFTWRLPEGIDLDARLVPPARVTAYADTATRRGLYQDLARCHPELDSLRGGAEVTRLRRRCHARHSRHWTPEQQGAALATAMGAVWPQARLFAAGLVADDACRARRAAPGTLQHRLYHCAATAAYRATALTPATAKAGAAANDGHPLYCRGIIPSSMLPRWQDRPTTAVDTTQWHRGRAGTVTGDIFTDGALIHAGLGELAVGGWAVAQLQAGENGYATCTASCSGRVQMDEPCLDALSCELVAVIKALSFSHGKITVLVRFRVPA